MNKSDMTSEHSVKKSEPNKAIGSKRSESLRFEDQDQIPPLPEDGYCLFTTGATSAGKSTFQHAIIHRLYTDEKMNLSFLNEEGKPIQDPDLQEWIFKFDRGEFPERTKKNKFQTFFIKFGQHQRLIKLSFVEIAGEHFEEILARLDELDHKPRLNSNLEQILTTPNLKKLFVFLADATRNDSSNSPIDSENSQHQRLYQDMMFSSLLQYFRILGMSRIKILFAATKWDEVSNRNMNPEKFFRENFPQTRAALRKFPKARVDYLRFSVGQVQIKETSGSTDNPKRTISKHDLKPIGCVIHWINYQATGKKLKGYPTIRRTVWQKLFDWAAS